MPGVMKGIKDTFNLGTYMLGNSLKHLKRVFYLFVLFFLAKILLEVEDREISCLSPASSDATVKMINCLHYQLLRFQFGPQIPNV